MEKVQKSGAVFNPKRLEFLNGFYIRQKSLAKLSDSLFNTALEFNSRVPTAPGKQPYRPAHTFVGVLDGYPNPCLGC